MTEPKRSPLLFCFLNAEFNITLMKPQCLDKDKLPSKLVSLELCPVQQFWYESHVNIEEIQPFLTRQIKLGR